MSAPPPNPTSIDDPTVASKVFFAAMKLASTRPNTRKPTGGLGRAGRGVGAGGFCVGCCGGFCWAAASSAVEIRTATERIAINARRMGGAYFRIPSPRSAARG